MKTARTRRAAGAIFALALLAAPAAAGSVPALTGMPAADDVLSLGMPLAGLDAYRAHPPGSRPSLRLAPLMEALAAAGYNREAVALYEEERGRLSEPSRSRAAYEAGRIHWRTREWKKALAAFRAVSPDSPLAGDAALAAARILAASGDASAVALAAKAGGGETGGVVRGEIAMAVGRREEAARIWAEELGGKAPGTSAWLRSTSGRDASPTDIAALRRGADNAAGFPARSAAYEGLVTALAAGGADNEALAAASRGLALGSAWADAARRRPDWDATNDGARHAWGAMVSLFPLDADGDRFLGDGMRFLALARLHETVRAAENGARAMARRVRSGRLEIDGLRAGTALSERRAGEIGARLERIASAVERTRDRLRAAAEELPTEGYGRRTHPGIAARLATADRTLARLAERQEEIRRRIEAAERTPGAGDSPGAERIMTYFAGTRLLRAQAVLLDLEGKVAFLRIRAWNEWKNAYDTTANGLLNAADNAARTARRAAARAQDIRIGVRASGGNLEQLSRMFSGSEGRLAAIAADLARRRGDVRNAAREAFDGARRDLGDAVAAAERRLHHLAGRAAAGQRIRGSAAAGASAPLPPAERKRLLREAIGHFEAALSPLSPGRTDDEALYALGELRFEETEAAYIDAGGPDKGARADFSVPAGIFRRVIDGFPSSPYREASYYGLALCRQESGDDDGAAETLTVLLGTHPRTRYADEIALRLGEHAFDRYEFREAEGWYRRISPAAAADLRATALFKLGWALFLLERPAEAADTFHAAVLASREARRTGGIPAESLRMLARSLVESGRQAEAERLLSDRGGAESGPMLLRQIQEVLEAQNRYEEAARIADRMGTAYPLAAERLEAETAAVDALRKGGKEEEGMARRGRLPAAVGPGSAWQKAPGRTPAEIGRADAAAEESLRAAVTYFHAKTREGSGPARSAVLAQYDGYIALFPASVRIEEMAFQRAWLLFEDGRKDESRRAFEAVARRAGGTHAEASWYMAVQAAKDVSSASDAPSQEEVVRLCRAYEGAAPSGGRLPLILMDRARAHFNLKAYAEAATAADLAATRAPNEKERRAALRLSGESRFEGSDFGAAEKSFRALRSLSTDPGERRDAEKWVGFSLFRRAETLPRPEAPSAAQLFLRVADEFPDLDIAPVARFRAGAAFADGGRPDDAIAAFLAVEADRNNATLSADATRRLAPLFESRGRPVEAASRYERIAGLPGADPADAPRLALHAADLYARGKQEAESRRLLRAVASRGDAPPEMRVRALFRVAESFRDERKADEADAAYAETVAAHRALGGAAPETAGRALFLRGEPRFLAFRAVKIVPPLEKTFRAKQEALEACTRLYLEAVDVGDADTVAGALHRLGEGFEEFRSAVLASPPPPELSAAEREEYVFLLEERAAPIEEKAAEAYRKNVNQAAVAGTDSSWARQSLARLQALRPARYRRKGEFALPVVTVPEFHGLIERSLP